MKELIKQLRNGQTHCTSSGNLLDMSSIMGDAAEALGQLMSGDVELPDPIYTNKHRAYEDSFSKDQMIDYGNRRAAQAVTAFLERSGKYLTNDATREAAIKAAALVERERCAQVANQQVMTSWNAETDAHNACAAKITSAIRKGDQA